MELPCINCITLPMCRSRYSFIGDSIDGVERIISFNSLYRSCSLLDSYLAREIMKDTYAYTKVRKRVYEYFENCV
jgi:hypothetical protein